MTSLEQLSIDEFIGVEARPKVYENDHKNVLAIWFDSMSQNSSNITYKLCCEKFSLRTQCVTMRINERLIRYDTVFASYIGI